MKCICSALKRNSDRNGFTLVELIVVIAILAILSAVAYPVYTGYIKKANEAADQVLIGAVNDAFVATCEDQGVDRFSLQYDEAKLDASAQPAIKGILSVIGLDAGALSNFQNAFNRYFDGNETTELKAIPITSIHFANGIFTTDKKSISDAQNKKAVSDFNMSNYNDHIDDLVKNVEGVTSLFSMVVGEPSGEKLEERLSMLSSFGIDTETAAKDLKKFGLTDESSSTEVANAMVLYVAQTTSAMDDTSVLIDDIMSGSLNQDRGLMELPMMIGMYTAYYNSDYASEDFKTNYSSAMSSPYGVLMLLLGDDITEDAGFAEYQEKEMRSDLNGYLGALRLVDQNKDSVDITRKDAFSNDEFMALIESVLGGN